MLGERNEEPRRHGFLGWQLVAIVTAVSCGTAAPAPEPPRASPTRADEDPTIEAAPSVDASVVNAPIGTETSRVPSAYAPPTAPRDYDGAACSARVAILRERLALAQAHWDHYSEVTNGDYPRLPTVRVDSDLGQPDVVIEVRGSKDRHAAEWSDCWGLTVRDGRRALKFDGRDRLARTIEAAKKRLPSGGRVGVEIADRRSIIEFVPLLVELSKTARLQLLVAAEGPPYAPPLDDAPAWAQERLLAIPTLPEDYPDYLRTKARRAAIVAAIPACEAFADAIADDDRARHVPDAVEQCGCDGIDVDALELFLGAFFSGDDVPSADRGWIEIKFVDASSTEIYEWQVGPAITSIAALSREQRTAGIEIVGAAPWPVYQQGEACDVGPPSR